MSEEHWKHLMRMAIVEFQNYDDAKDFICMLQQITAETRNWA